jgi:hypothetical protein
MSKVSSAIINEGLDTEFTLTETIYGDFSYNYDFRIKDKTLEMKMILLFLNSLQNLFII